MEVNSTTFLSLKAASNFFFFFFYKSPLPRRWWADCSFIYCTLYGTKTDSGLAARVRAHERRTMNCRARHREHSVCFRSGYFFQ